MGILYPDHPQTGHHPLNQYSTLLYEQQTHRRSYKEHPRCFESSSALQSTEHTQSYHTSTTSSACPTLDDYSNSLPLSGSKERDVPAVGLWERGRQEEEHARRKNGRDKRDERKRSTSPSSRRECEASSKRKRRRRSNPHQPLSNHDRGLKEESRVKGPRPRYPASRNTSSIHKRSSKYGNVIETDSQLAEPSFHGGSEIIPEGKYRSSSSVNNNRKRRSDRTLREPRQRSRDREEKQDFEESLQAENSLPRQPEPLADPRRMDRARSSHTMQDDHDHSRRPELGTRYSRSPLHSPHPRSTVDVESLGDWDQEKASRRHRRQKHSDEPSVWEEVEFYKFGRVPEEYRARRQCFFSTWSRKRKLIFFGSIASSIVVLIIIIAAAAAAASANGGNKYGSSSAHVTNAEAFKSGGATHNNPSDTNDGAGAGVDEYTYYSGDASNFPTSSKWVSFEDMWKNNLNSLQNSCGWLNEGQNDSPQDISDIYYAIQNRAKASLVDQRFIFATILQESSGCVHVGQTTSSGGVTNPGLMQSHDGHSYDASDSKGSILAMVQDGTQGTKEGAGLVQYLNQYGNPYDAARGYNSGHIAADGNLSAAAGATACYVSDIANRLTGWVNAQSTCPGDTA